MSYSSQLCYSLTYLIIDRVNVLIYNFYLILFLVINRFFYEFE